MSGMGNLRVQVDHERTETTQLTLQRLICRLDLPLPLTSILVRIPELLYSAQNTAIARRRLPKLLQYLGLLAENLVGALDGILNLIPQPLPALPLDEIGASFQGVLDLRDGVLGGLGFGG